LSSENSGNKLADFKPISNPSINIMRQSLNDSNEYKHTTFDDLIPKSLERSKDEYSSNDNYT
jgi:hypothetical protein